MPVAKPGEPVCRHCQKNKVNRPRGLCWSCTYKPGVKELYPTKETRYTRRGAGCGNPRGALPVPTDILPGPGKVALLEERASKGLSLFHPAEPKIRNPLGHSTSNKRKALRGSLVFPFVKIETLNDKN